MHLTDCFAELIAYVVSFRKTVAQEQPPYESVRNNILGLLKKSEEFPASGACRQEDYDQARYAVFAWIDETILESSWKESKKWRPELLQRLYYKSADAGERFFKKLSSLGPHQKDIREVYYLCLTLGFQGQFCGPEDEPVLNQLKDRQLKLIFDGALETPTVPILEKKKLFPGAYSKGSLDPDSGQKMSPQRLFWLSTVGGPLAFLFLLFLIYRFTLFAIGQGILKSVGAP